MKRLRPAAARAENTVEVHLSRTYRKLGIRSRWQLIRYGTSLAAADASPPSAPRTAARATVSAEP